LPKAPRYGKIYLMNKKMLKTTAAKIPAKPKEKPANLSSDRIYRKLFAHPKMVEDLVKNFVNERFVEHIDFSTLRELKTKFVTDKNGFRESDAMYELKISDETVYFYILLEFQSTVDKFMPVRMLTYIMLFYQDWLKKQIEYKRQKKEKEKGGVLDETDIEAIYETIKLPAVFPILLYNGERKWTTPTELKELIGVRYKALGKYIPNFAYYKIIENEFSKKSLGELESINAAMFGIETSKDPKVISECALRLTQLLNKEANSELRRDFKMWLNQLIRGFGIKKNEAAKILKDLEEGNMTNLESNIRKMKEEAKEEGKLKGKIEGKIETALKLLELGVEMSKIVKATGLSETEIKKLKTTSKKAA